MQEAALRLINKYYYLSNYYFEFLILNFLFVCLISLRDPIRATVIYLVNLKNSFLPYRKI